MQIEIEGLAFNLYILHADQELIEKSQKNMYWCKHSPSSFSLFKSCAFVGRAYIPAATAFLIAHPW